MMFPSFKILLFKS
ncbi:hypothetical protein LINPERHAP2_LOCUS9106 [Linum perenne]